MLEEGNVDSPSISLVIETAEVTRVKFLVTESDMIPVFPTMLSVEVGAVNISDVVAGVWLTLAGDEVVVSPEEDVSRGVPAVRVCPRGDDEGVDEVTSVMVVL